MTISMKRDVNTIIYLKGRQKSNLGDPRRLGLGGGSLDLD